MLSADGALCIIDDVEIKKLHGWELSVAQALDWQRRLAAQVSRNSELSTPNFIAGVDISKGSALGMATGAVVVLSYPELRLVETKVARGRLNFPYIPGFLSFRESPLVLAACEKLSIIPDLMLVDGQGVAHPRRFGFASHLGLFLDIPTVGCAKSLLCGRHDEPGAESGSYAEVIDQGEIIGAALRSRLGSKPIYVSIGHKVKLKAAIHWVLACCRGYRLPEPCRLAHRAAGGNLGHEKDLTQSEASYQGEMFD